MKYIYDLFHAVNNLNDTKPLDTDVIDEIRCMDEANTHLLFLKAADGVTNNALSQAKQALFTGQLYLCYLVYPWLLFNCAVCLD